MTPLGESHADSLGSIVTLSSGDMIAQIASTTPRISLMPCASSASMMNVSSVCSSCKSPSMTNTEPSSVNLKEDEPWSALCLRTLSKLGMIDGLSAGVADARSSFRTSGLCPSPRNASAASIETSECVIHSKNPMPESALSSACLPSDSPPKGGTRISKSSTIGMLL